MSADSRIAVPRRRPLLAADRVAGFLAPLCIFVEPGSDIFLADSTLAESNIAFPLSLLAVPFYLSYAFHPEFHRYISAKIGVLTATIAAFVLYCVVASLAVSALFDQTAVLYAGQWILLFLWLPYFITIVGTERLSTFLRWFIIGFSFNLFWYFTSAAIEMFMHGGLGDGGRMTQNRVFPGQYQLAVYVPTSIAVSVSLLNAFAWGKIVQISKHWLIGLNFVAVLTLFALGAREGILVFVLATILLIIARNPHIRLPALFIAAIVGIFLITNLSFILDEFASSDLRVLNKIARLEDSTARFGGRDVMIREALKIFWYDPYLGSHFLPPNSNHYRHFVSVPSAHNMYVDAFVWTGIFGGVLFLCICLMLLTRNIGNITSSENRVSLGVKLVSVVFVVFLLVSNNTNVPMRQPLLAPVVALMIAVCLYPKLSGNRFQQR